MDSEIIFTAQTTYEDILTFKKSDIQAFLSKNRFPINGNKPVLAQRALECIQLSLGVSQSLNKESSSCLDYSASLAIVDDINFPNIESLKFGWSSETGRFPKLKQKGVENCLIHSSHRTEDQENMQCYRQFIRGYNFFKEGYIHKVMVNEINERTA
jgi:hypothetical protein